MSKLVIYGEKTDGKLSIRDRKVLDAFISTLEEGDPVEISVHKVDDYRTARQNRLYWKYLRSICKTYGEYTPEEFHDYFKGKCLCYTIVIAGEEAKHCKSTADLDKKEFSEYIEYIIKWAAQQLNMHLATPEELQFLKASKA